MTLQLPAQYRPETMAQTTVVTSFAVRWLLAHTAVLVAVNHPQIGQTTVMQTETVMATIEAALVKAGIEAPSKGWRTLYFKEELDLELLPGSWTNQGLSQTIDIEMRLIDCFTLLCALHLGRRYPGMPTGFQAILLDMGLNLQALLHDHGLPPVVNWDTPAG